MSVDFGDFVVALVNSPMHTDGDADSNADHGTNNDQGHQHLDQESLSFWQCSQPFAPPWLWFCHALLLLAPESEEAGICVISIPLFLCDGGR